MLYLCKIKGKHPDSGMIKEFYKYILAAFFVFICSYAMAQTSECGTLRFRATIIDYGTIAEDGGMVTKYVDAKNVGDAPVYIDNVVASCGCTNVEYSRNAVMPGSSTTIGITFDPRDRPGRFEREVMVVLAHSDERIVIDLKGYVTPRARSVYEIYPFDMGGGLRMESNFHAFAYIEHGKSVEERIAYINNSDKSIKLDIIYKERSGALTVSYPKSIAPHATGDIVLCYALDEESARYGTLSDIFQFKVDGKNSSTMLSTYAIAVDNFDLVEDILAPSAVVSKKIIKFGEILLGNGVVEESISLSNSGETPLIIRCVESDSPAVEVKIVGSHSIDKGKTTMLVIRLNTALVEECDTPFASRVRVICNDPISPMQVIKVTAIPL